MSEIRRLTAQGIEEYVDIVIDAYPGFKISSEEDRRRLIERLQKVQEEVPPLHLYGLYREDRLLGGMRLHDFWLNVLGTEVSAGGVGMVAVDLLHKKEHVAKELLLFFLEHYRRRGARMALLYPFRPDFYYAMHFGYGAKISQYRFRPAALRRGPSKAEVRSLSAEDRSALAACYDRYQAQTHGMIVRHAHEWDPWFRNLGLENRIAGCVLDDRLEGYLIFGFKARPVESPLRNDLVVKELVYTSREALAELLTFLHSQADQVERIILATHDASFHHLLLDPRDECETLIPSVYHESNVQGVGLMYRIIDVPGIFDDLRDHDFNGQSCRLKLTVSDSFLPGNAGSTLLHFEAGRVTLPGSGEHEVELALNVAELSSLLMGVVDLRSLHTYGLAELSEAAYLETLNRLFAVEQKPVCLTAF
ncbi:MAG: enhanced intracellular survival protein Eis [Anaerolineales bacterium]